MESVERDGIKFYLADDGKEYKSRSGAWKWNKKLMEESEQSDVGEQHTPPVEVAHTSSPIEDSNPSSSSESIDENEVEEPSWTQYTYSSEEIIDNIPVPVGLKMLKGDSKKSKKKLTAKEMVAVKKENEFILGLGYRSVDGIASKYRIALTGDESKVISHSEADYNWISGISNRYLTEKGLNLSSYLGAGRVALVANGWWFGKIGHTLQQEAKNAEKKIRPLRAVLSWPKKLLSKLPIIGKRFKPKPTVMEMEIEYYE